MYLRSGVLVALSLSMMGMSEAGVRGMVLGVYIEAFTLIYMYCVHTYTCSIMCSLMGSQVKRISFMQ